MALIDANAILAGEHTPAVRQLPPGGLVLGMADAVVLIDPLTGQGFNNAAKGACTYLDFPPAIIWADRFSGSPNGRRCVASGGVADSTTRRCSRAMGISMVTWPGR